MTLGHQLNACWHGSIAWQDSVRQSMYVLYVHLGFKVVGLPPLPL